MSRSGSSLIELIVAVAIVGIGVTGVSSLTATAARIVVRAKALDEAHATLLSFVDSIRAGASAGSGQKALALGTVSWNVPNTPGTEAWVQFDHVALPDPVLVRFSVVSHPGVP